MKKKLFLFLPDRFIKRMFLVLAGALIVFMLMNIAFLAFFDRVKAGQEILLSLFPPLISSALMTLGFVPALENELRRRNGHKLFLVPNRYGRWEMEGYVLSQAINVLFIGLGVYLILALS